MILEHNRNENYEHFKRNIKYFQEEDPSLKIKAEHFGNSAMFPFIKHSSSPRGIMSESQKSQAVSLHKPMPNIIQGGMDQEMGKFVIGKKIEDTSEIIIVIDRKVFGKDVIPERLVIFRDLTTGIVDCLDVPLYNKLSTYFGFKYEIDEEIDNYSKGDILPKDHFIAKPRTLEEDGSYSLGRDVNVCLMPLDDNDEDGFIISESMSKDFEFSMFETRTIEVSEDEFLIDLNQEKDSPYKGIPELGDVIREDGVIFGTRNYDPISGPALLSKNDLKEYNPLFDNIVYGRANATGTVIDVKVYSNRKRRREPPTGTTERLDVYKESLVNYYKQIINTFESLNKENNILYGKDLVVGDYFNTILREAYGIVESSKPNSKIKKMYKLSKLGLYRIEVVIEYKLNLTNYTGIKYSDLSANKGVSVSVRKDEDMPFDGIRRADLIMDIKSTTSRLNVGRLYEHYIKGAMVTVDRYVHNLYNTYNLDNVEDLTDAQVKELFKIPYDFVMYLENALTDSYKEVVKTNDIEMMRDVVYNIINDRFRIYINAGSEKDFYTMVEELSKSKFKPLKTKLTHSLYGKKVITKNDFMIAPMYIILLSKIASDVLTTSSAPVNHFGVPVTISKNKKYSLPFKNTPVRTQGETEVRIIAAYGGTEMVAELKDLNASINSHAIAYSNILKADKPTNIDKLINRKKVPYGGDRALAILNTLFHSIGFKISYVKETGRYVEASDLEDSDSVLLDMDGIADIGEID